MKLARRQLAQILLGSAALGICGWHDTRVAWAVTTIDTSLYPTLARLASLHSNDAVCRRVASALDASAVRVLTESGLVRAERNAARAFAGRLGTGSSAVRLLLADDFRKGRTVQAAGFRLAETEGAMLLVRLAAVSV
jgi:hypothetical protein